MSAWKRGKENICSSLSDTSQVAIVGIILLAADLWILWVVFNLFQADFKISHVSFLIIQVYLLAKVEVAIINIDVVQIDLNLYVLFQLKVHK